MDTPVFQLLLEQFKVFLPLRGHMLCQWGESLPHQCRGEDGNLKNEDCPVSEYKCPTRVNPLCIFNEIFSICGEFCELLTIKV